MDGPPVKAQLAYHVAMKHARLPFRLGQKPREKGNVCLTRFYSAKKIQISAVKVCQNQCTINLLTMISIVICFPFFYTRRRASFCTLIIIELWVICLGGGKGYFRHSLKWFYIKGIAVGQPPISYHF